MIRDDDSLLCSLLLLCPSTIRSSVLASSVGFVFIVSNLGKCVRKMADLSNFEPTVDECGRLLDPARIGDAKGGGGDRLARLE